MSTILSSKFSKTYGDQFFSVISFAIAISVYLIRFALGDFIWGAAHGILLIYLLPAICLVAVVGLSFLTIVLYRGISTAGTPAPLIILVVGLVSACFVLPSPTYEERSFFLHKQDYVKLVQLAEQGILPKSEQCNTRVAFGVPDGFEKFIKDCILVYRDPNFTVEFWTRSYAAPIVYVENVKDLKDHFTCSINGEIIKQLDENWFLCRMEAD